jgi:glycosyltransferase involved in cell wall biosynthesis
MSGKVLHILSQRPGKTGSGVTLDALVRQAGTAGWHQKALVGIPVSETTPRVGELPAADIETVTFRAGFGPAGEDLPFPVPGMSDVMPYPSSVWSHLSPGDLAAYRTVWSHRIGEVVRGFQPDIIQTNHIWLMSSLVPDAAPGVPIVAACHATGLRQMELTPHLRDEVIAGCRRIDRFSVLRNDHRDTLAATLQVDPGRIAVTQAGYRDELFHPLPAGDGPSLGHVLFVGKYSAAKGLPWLLDAVERLAPDHPGLRLHIAGGGAGTEAEALRARMEDLVPLVTMHGQLDQPALADLMRRCAVCVLPSFYEGVPLVLVEAAACGCRLVSTDLPGVREQIAPGLDPVIRLVELPRLENVDQPVAADLPRFTANLASALADALDRPPESPPDLDAFTWESVFRRTESIWRELGG